MALETIIYVCAANVPWELDAKDKKIIEKHQTKPIAFILEKLRKAATK